MPTTDRLTFATETCTRCAGEKSFRQYSHVRAGRCFTCKGTGRKLSRAGRAAQKAFEQLVAERTGIDCAAVTVGMVIESTSPLGVPWSVDRIDTVVNDATGTATRWAVSVRPNGEDRCTLPAGHTMLRHMPEVVEQAAREIAGRYKGATYC
ncbi:hypothetical protein ACFV1L_21795 [Kitasatospora sp. NPDC059646]|uniref:hypothetical protein n=1 Tax=Kitasatospora sp. NPDC059646 TaxID=3346893 RepID=UPI0036C3A802